MSRASKFRQSRQVLWVAVFGMTAALASIEPIRAAEIDTAIPSLKWIPEDAAFYSAMLRNREQIEILLQSKAWARFRDLPLVQSGWKMLSGALEQQDGPLADFHKFVAQPENKKLIELLGDMVSEEIFTYGGASSVEFVTLISQLGGSMRFQQVYLQFQKRGDDSWLSYVQAVLNVLASQQHLLKIPEFVMGFRISEPQQAEAQLARLETLLKGVIAQAPPLEGRLHRTKAGKDSYLTLNLDGRMIPWDQVPIKQLEEKPGQYDDLIKKLKGLKLTISLGLHGKYVLFGMGESSEFLAALGEKTSGRGLAGRPEFKPLTQFADRRITSVNYISKSLSGRFGYTAEDIKDLLNMVNEYLPPNILPDAQKQQIRKDLGELAKDLKPLLPVPAASVDFTFLTSQGSESYAYDRSENPTRDGSKPLTLLHHLGGNPLIASVGRSKISPDGYRLVVKWIKILNGYAEQFLVPMLDGNQKEQYQKFAKAAYPLFKRLDQVTGTMFLPALADGQGAFVLDAKITSKEWIKLLPPTEAALPMLEPALVLGVSDAKLLRQAMHEYRVIANELLPMIRELVGGDFPEIQIPAPEMKAGKGGDLYYYPLPEIVPLDRRLVPTAGMSNDVAVLTISHEHAERLLASTTLNIESGLLRDTKRNLALASYVNCAGLMDAVSPWVEMAVQFVQPFVGLAVPEIAGREDLVGQTRTIIQILKVFRHHASATYRENGAWVTHGETVLKDL